MNNYFLVKVKCHEQNHEGIFKRKSYPILVAALSFTEAESRIYQHFETLRSVRDFSISSMKIVEYHDILENDASEGFCDVKISFGSMEEESKKKIIKKLLVSADNVEEATSSVMEYYSGILTDYKIESVSSSPIDIILKKEDDEQQNSFISNNETNDDENQEIIEHIILNK